MLTETTLKKSPIERRCSRTPPMVELICDVRPYYGHRLGARVVPEGVSFWCKDCKQAHILTWSELDVARAAVAFPAGSR